MLITFCHEHMHIFLWNFTLFLRGDFVTFVMFHEFVGIRETRFVLVIVNDNSRVTFSHTINENSPIGIDKYNDWLAITKQTIQITVITLYVSLKLYY